MPGASPILAYRAGIARGRMGWASGWPVVLYCIAKETDKAGPDNYCPTRVLRYFSAEKL